MKDEFEAEIARQNAADDLANLPQQERVIRKTSAQLEALKKEQASKP